MTQELLDVKPRVISSQSLRMGHNANPIKLRSLTSKEFEDDVVDSSLIVDSLNDVLATAFGSFDADTIPECIFAQDSFSEGCEATRLRQATEQECRLNWFSSKAREQRQGSD